jgi:hypothetical protein
MVIDTTLFNNEFDMLDIHLELTSKYVDRWIVLEASRTFSGLPKPYYLSERLAEYNQRWNNRIQVIQLPLTEQETNLLCETLMRRGFRQALHDCDANDIVIHGDLDEIINPLEWTNIVALMDQHDQPVSCSMQMYMYRFDQQAERGWRGSVVARRRMFDTPHDLYKGSLQVAKRKDRSRCVSLDHPVGWHWTWMGNDDSIRTKVRSCIESQHRDPEQVLTAFKQKDTTVAINHKCVSHVVTANYPAEVQSVLNRFPYLWHNPPVNKDV